jgi:hypothetical protein
MRNKIKARSLHNVAFFARSAAIYLEIHVFTSSVLCVNGNSFSSVRNDSLTLFIRGKRKFMVTIKDIKHEGW